MPKDYKVGFGKPPKDSQFQKGQSGNKKGRPKGAKNLKTILVELLDQPVTVREGERIYKVSRQQAVMMALIAKGLKGNVPAFNSLINLLRSLGLHDSVPDAEQVLTPAEQKMFDALKALIADEGQSNENIQPGGDEET